MVAEPKYRTIADDLRGKIESGELGQGTQLPTEIDLMDSYSASRNTVRDAIRLLTTRGLVETRAGQGTFVVEKINPFVTTLTVDPVAGSRGPDDDSVYVAEIRKAGRFPTSTEPRVEVQKADAVLARALRVNEGDQLVSRHQQRFIDDTPWSLQTTFYSMSLVHQGATRLLEAADIPEGAVSYLATELGVRQVGYRDTIAVRAPKEDEAAFFKLPPDGRISMFEIFRVGFDADGGRMRLTVTVYPADRNRFRVDVGEVPPRVTDPEA